MKSIFEKPKKQRVKRNYSHILVLLSGGYHWENRLIFDKKGLPYRLNEQKAFERVGIPSIFNAVNGCTSDNTEYWLSSGKSFKSAMRAINKMKPYLPDRSVIQLCSSWVGHSIKFNIYNPTPTPSNNSFILRSGYSRLTGSDINFDNLTLALRNKGFLVEVELVVKDEYHSIKYCGPWPGDYYRASFTGNNIKGAFSQESSNMYSGISGKLFAEYYDNFNKWSQTPIKVKIPTNDTEMESLLVALEAEGYPNN